MGRAVPALSISSKLVEARTYCTVGKEEASITFNVILHSEGAKISDKFVNGKNREYHFKMAVILH